MDFGEALKKLKSGKKVYRKNWNGKNQYIELAIGISYTTLESTEGDVNHITMGNKVIIFNGTQGIQIGWLASQADILSDDWEEVE